MFNYKNKIYNHEKLDDTWSQPSYVEKYKDLDKTWSWRQLPNFDISHKKIEKPKNLIKGSILEIGSATGGAFKYLKSNNVFSEDLKYYGLDISEHGISYCKEHYPNASWIKQDLSLKKINDTYDYIFERIAVHHMPKPLEIFRNLTEKTNKSISTSFVSCINGDTISNLDISRYRHSSGEYVFFNIINIFEVLEIFLSKFNLIHIYYGGPHEQIYNDSTGYQYLSPEVDQDKRRIGRTTIIASMSKDLKEKKIIFLNNNSFLKSIIKKFLSVSNRKYRNDFEIIEKMVKNFVNRKTNQTVYNSPYAPK